jgi:flagellar hook-basal body complex protein FliE
MAGIGVIPPYSGGGIGIGAELQAAAPTPQKGTFAEELKNFISNVDQMQKTSENLTNEFAQGRQNDIHGTMIAATQAGISFHLLSSVRNRVIEAYREIMRMGV